MNLNNPIISKSGLDKIDSSPLDYWWTYLRPNRDVYVPSKQELFDDALRMSVFNPKMFSEKYIKMPVVNTRTNIGKSEIESLQRVADMNAQILISSSDYIKILEMTSIIKNHVTTKILCSSGYVGLPSILKEENSDVNIKFTPHFVNSKGFIINLSSCEDISLNKFQKECYNLRHDKKAFIQVEGLQMENIIFISIENKAPYKFSVRYLDERTLKLGKETVLRNCDTYMKCLESGIWSGITEMIEPAGMPEWVYKL